MAQKGASENKEPKGRPSTPRSRSYRPLNAKTPQGQTKPGTWHLHGKAEFLFVGNVRTDGPFPAGLLHRTSGSPSVADSMKKD